MNIEQEIKTLVTLRDRAADVCETEMMVAIERVMFAMHMQNKKIEKLQDQLKLTKAILTVTDNSLENAIDSIRELQR
jgi:hypothetical protein